MNLDWSGLLHALGLVMVIEGLLPFAAPSQWRRMLFTVAQMEARSLRVLGFLSMAAGLALLHFS
ncbi:DUF2065 domain-containing protein [Sinimarinibacterium sp. CAU 1509]|uniref:DUF2065 domain-containing protein n=1 Tax=Sinimarinibacterium sp. CAU 1509 TaxID=2562283 RepID=UPI0010AD2C79|nr:DUF2065 domain-containing protein [Sinimarinibacterium sp. CAU 1509]TJY60922.1 DUF2065 domain-containing protein [Sinimarinibacterium sp. CAU 1509]